MPIRQRLEPFVREMELSRHSRDGRTETWRWQRWWRVGGCYRPPKHPHLRAVGVWGHLHPLRHPENLSRELGGIQRIRLCPGRPRGPGCSDFWQPPFPPLLVK